MSVTLDNDLEVSVSLTEEQLAIMLNFIRQYGDQHNNVLPPPLKSLFDTLLQAYWLLAPQPTNMAIDSNGQAIEVIEEEPESQLNKYLQTR